MTGILQKYTWTPMTESLTAAASNVTGAGPWTGLTAPTDGFAHQVSVRNDTANNHSAKTLTVTGADADGRTQSETLAAPGASATVETAKYYKTLTSVAISSTIGADTFDIGYVDEFVSESTPLNFRSAIGAKFFLDVTGTINLDVQFTIADPVHFADQNANLWVEPYATLTAETADSTAVVAADPGYAFWRLQVNSYSAGAKVDLYVAQPR